MMKKLKGIKWFNVILFLFVMVGLLVLAQFFVRPNMEGWDVERVLHYEAANDINIIYDYIYSSLSIEILCKKRPVFAEMQTWPLLNRLFYYSAVKTPDLPPSFLTRRISVICMPLSIALHMS